MSEEFQTAAYRDVRERRLSILGITRDVYVSELNSFVNYVSMSFKDNTEGMKVLEEFRKTRSKELLSQFMSYVEEGKL